MSAEFDDIVIDNMMENDRGDYLIRELRLYHKETVCQLLLLLLLFHILNVQLIGRLQPNLESHFIIYYEKFEGADRESTIYFCASHIVSKLYAFEV